MDWNEALRRIANGEDTLHVLETKAHEDREGVRAYLVEEAKTNPRALGALASFDQSMKDLDTGVMGARGTWQSISATQKLVLQNAATYGGRVTKITGSSGYQLRLANGLLGIARSTVRALCDRELMAWDGGAFTPEAAAVITERGRFAVTHGGSYGYGG